MKTCRTQISVSKLEGIPAVQLFSEVMAWRKSHRVCFSFPETRNASKETKQNCGTVK